MRSGPIAGDPTKGAALDAVTHRLSCGIAARVFKPGPPCRERSGARLRHLLSFIVVPLRCRFLLPFLQLFVSVRRLSRSCDRDRRIAVIIAWFVPGNRH